MRNESHETAGVQSVPVNDLAEVDVVALRAQLNIAEAALKAAMDAVPAMPAGVGTGGADTTILILLELRLRSGDAQTAAEARAAMLRIAEHEQAEAAAQPAHVEYSRLYHLVKKADRMARGYPA